jgi:hypothetical protein
MWNRPITKEHIKLNYILKVHKWITVIKVKNFSQQTDRGWLGFVMFGTP